jgi:hypothetical protein
MVRLPLYFFPYVTVFLVRVSSSLGFKLFIYV